MSAEIVATLSLAAAIGSGSFMISKSKMFAVPRDWAERRKQNGLLWAWLSGVLICPYCTGTWLSLAAVAIYRPRLVHEWAPLDYLVMVMVINGLAMMPVLIIRQAVGMRDSDHSSPPAGSPKITDGLLTTSGARRSSESAIRLSRQLTSSGQACRVAAPGRCASATAPPTSFSWTSTAKPWMRSLLETTLD